MVAAGLNGPGVDMSGSGAGFLSKLAAAAAASRSRPSAEARSGSNSGNAERDPAARGCASEPGGGIDSYRNTGGRWGGGSSSTGTRPS